MQERREYNVQDGRLTIAERENQWYILRAICERGLIQQEKFPIDVNDLVDDLMPLDEYAAYKTLEHHVNVFQTKTTQNVILPEPCKTADPKALDTRQDGERGIQLATNKGSWNKHYSGMGAVFINAYEEGLPLTSESKYYDEVMQWAYAQWKREEATLISLGAIQSILSELNTIGQIKRAAGELLPFFSERFQEAASKYTKKSPLPKGFYNNTQKKVIDFAIAHVSKNSLLPRTESEEDYYSCSWRSNYELPTAVRFASYAGDPRRNAYFRA